MKVDTVIQWFMPKEEGFRDLFARDTTNLLRAVRVFQAIAHSASLEERRVKMVELRAIEHEGDTITRQIFDALNSTFITPFDREDIRSIATDLDDILDYPRGDRPAPGPVRARGVARGAAPVRRHPGRRWCEQVDELTRMIWDLSTGRAHPGGIVRISDLENEADLLYNSVIADLFKGEGPSIRSRS